MLPILPNITDVTTTANSADCSWILLSISNITMLFESRFKSSFGNVNKCNLKKLQLSFSPSPLWPQAALWLGGDGRQVFKAESKTELSLVCSL